MTDSRPASDGAVAENRVPEGRVTVAPTPAWRLRLAARAPRLIVGVLAIVLIVAGLRATFAGPPQAPPAVVVTAAGDQSADAFAEGFARVYLTWDPERPELREEALARFVDQGLDLALEFGSDAEPQTVEWTTVTGSVPRGRDQRLVTVAAVADDREWHLAVRVGRDEHGRLLIAGQPALVGPPPVAREEPRVQEDDVTDPRLRAVAERAVRNYVAADRDDLLADLHPRASVSLPPTAGEVRAVDAITHAGRSRVAVAVTVSVAGATLPLRYELAMARRDRWYVMTVESDPRALPSMRGPSLPGRRP